MNSTNTHSTQIFFFSERKMCQFPDSFSRQANAKNTRKCDLRDPNFKIVNGIPQGHTKVAKQSLTKRLQKKLREGFRG